MVSLASKKLFYLLCILILVLGCDTATFAKTRKYPIFHQVVETRPRADTVSLRIKKTELAINIQHIGGIGKTKIELEAGDWPDGLTIVFKNFGGLEGCKISTATRQFDASIPHANKERVIQLGEGFTATRRGKSTYLNAPPNFVRKNEKFLQLAWVDFYRP